MNSRPYASLYIHVPFCSGKCDYCAFYSLPDDQNAAATHQLYLQRLKEEFRQYQAQCQPLHSIYLGGGTPSVLSVQELSDLLTTVSMMFTREEDCEWTMEANPDSLTQEKLDLAVSVGVNRLSLGIQSFAPAWRQVLGRNGTLDNLQNIQRACQRLGMHNLNLDLIYAIPGQAAEDFQRDLQQACECYQPSHLSTYALTIEVESKISQRLQADPDDELFLECWQQADDICRQFGLERYEISNFAVPGHQCRHNFEIWHGQTYLGCGPAAVSFDGLNRRANPDNLHDWLAGAVGSDDILPPEARAAEILAFGMRTLAGWDYQQFHALTGYTPRELRGAAIDKLCKLGLLIDNGRNLHPTRKGLLFNDNILAELL